MTVSHSRQSDNLSRRSEAKADLSRQAMTERENIFVENDEEIPSIIARIKSAKSRKIALVVPRGSAVLQSLVNLKLLKKQAKDLDKEMHLVTTDSVARNLASQAGLEVYETIHSNKPSLEPKRKLPQTDKVIRIDRTAPEPSQVPIHHFQDSNDRKTAPTSDSSQSGQVGGEERKPEDQPLTVKESGTGEGKRDGVTKLGRFSSIRISLRPGPRIGKTKVIIGGILTVIILVLLYFFIPRAVITLVVEGEDFEDSLRIEVNTSIKTISLEERRIPGHLAEVERQTERSFQASGVKNVGEKSQGQVTFYNYWSTDVQTVPAATVLSKDNRRFLTMADVSVPGATLSLSEGSIVTNPGTASGAVQAAEAGEEYNVSAGKFSIVSFSSDKQKKFYAESSQAFSGGSTREVIVVSAEDLEKASQELRNSLSQEILAELKEKNQDKIVLGDAIEYTITSRQATAQENQEIRDFSLALRLRGQAIIFGKETFQKSFVDLVRLELPEDKDLHLDTDDQFVISVKENDIEEGRLIVEGSIKAQIVPKLDQARLKKIIYGKKAAQAKELLEAQPDIEAVEIDISPQWLPYRIPYFDFAVKSKIEYR
jgi:hypothetical protein